MLRREKITLSFWLCLSLFFCIEAWRLGLGNVNAPGPGFLAFGVSLVIVLFVFILFLKERGKKRVEIGAPLFRGKRVQNVIYALGFLFLYPLLFYQLGFFLCTLFFVGFCLKMIEPQRWRVVIGFSIGVAVLAYLLFDTWLGIQLPKGIWVSQFFP